MASKVLVKIPAVNFNAQVGKCGGDRVGGSSIRPSVAETSPTSSSSGKSDTSSPYFSGHDADTRVAQLEQNIRFLKDQHNIMLFSLHQEVESLRQRNRDLQFQLVFSRGTIDLVKSTPSSPEDDSKSELVQSPKQPNATSLQVEILERDIAELRVSLTDANDRNSHLQNIVDEQAKQLESLYKEMNLSDNQTTRSSAELEEENKNAQGAISELTFKLEEAEKVIRRLRREGDDQRRELAVAKAKQNRSHQQHRDQRRDQPHDQTRDGSRFPPLLTQNFWHSNSNPHHGRWNNSWEANRGGANGPRQMKPTLSTLPALPVQVNSNAMNLPSCSGGSAPISLPSHSGGSRRGHRGHFRSDRGGGNSAMSGGGRGSGDYTHHTQGRNQSGHWEMRDHRPQDRDRYRDQTHDD